MVILTKEQQAAWRALVVATHSLEEALDRQSRRDGGIPHAYYKLLVFLYERNDKRTSMSALAAQLRHSQSRLTHAVASLERSGWVRRVRSSDDRRVQFVELTDAGAAVVRTVTPGQVESVRAKIVHAMSPEDVATLERLSIAISAALDESAGT